MEKRLQDVELQAMMQRAGIWSETDPKVLAEFRAQQRGEEAQVKELRVRLSAAPAGLVNLNTASARELQSVSGIGPVLASRIIANRPYHDLDDLLRVPGISHTLLDRLRPQLAVSDAPEQKGATAK
ncbi:MAG: helix-hairpin-helix domain-containing protein [Verrucomicrobia bacterium]|nr:helix-hairpin-helix domain-containing protein [Verrucomicrobiota bacterium]